MDPKRDAEALSNCLLEIFDMDVFPLKLRKADQSPYLPLRSTIDHVRDRINPYGNSKGERSLLILSYVGALSAILF